MLEALLLSSLHICHGGTALPSCDDLPVLSSIGDGTAFPPDAGGHVPNTIHLSGSEPIRNLKICILTS